jgi:toxin ParE1/3/4
MEVIIAPAARSDIAAILAWTDENFGSKTLKRYARLIATAIAEVATDPDLPGSRHRPEIAHRCRTYHLYFSRQSAGRPRDRVQRPRHFLLYRVTTSNVVEIGRVLHDSMELRGNLPEEYRSPTE